MSTYLKMWEYVKELTPEQRDEALTELRPARGRDVIIPSKNITVNDVDLIEALVNAR